MARRKQQVNVQSSSDSDEISSEDPVFTEAKGAADRSPEERDVLLTIPVWGWQYSGKTCSILTAMHYARPQLHGAGLALPKSRGVLESIEQDNDVYRGMDLASIADSTISRLTEMNDLFFNRLEWPPGTDSPVHYLMEIRGVRGRAGHLFIPDIMGGSFEKGDSIAENAMSSAQALVMMIDPTQYTGATPRAKEYQDDVLRTIQDCSERGIALCVMVAKSDDPGVPAEVIDEAQENLKILVANQSEDFKCLVLRTSVIDDQTAGEKPQVAGADEGASLKLPAANERRPFNLVKGWIWAITHALKVERTEVRQRPPKVNLRAETPRPVPVGATREPELRFVAKVQTKGTLVASADIGAKVGFTTMDSSTGVLSEFRVDTEDGVVSTPTTRQLEGWTPTTASIVSERFESVDFVAPTATDRIWWGSGGPVLKPSALPMAVAGWTAISDRHLAVVLPNGTVHILYAKGGVWTTASFVSNAVDPGASLACSFVSERRSFVVCNGTTVRMIDVSERMKFGAASSVKNVVRFDEDGKINQFAFTMGVRKEGRVLVAGRESMSELQASFPETGCFSLARRASYAAWSDASTVASASLGARGARNVRADVPAASNVTSLLWSPTATLLAATTDDGVLVWRRLGF